MLKEYMEERYGKNRAVALNFEKREIKNREDGIYYLSNILSIMSKYDGKNKTVLDEIETWSRISYLNGNMMPLPSGRLGGTLAVALEMHKYLVALEILNNPEKYYSNLNAVSHITGGKPWSAEETFDFSLLSFDERACRNFAKEEDWQKHYSEEQIAEMIKKEEANVAAAEEIASRFSKEGAFNISTTTSYEDVIKKQSESLDEFKAYLQEHYDDNEIDEMLKKGIF